MVRQKSCASYKDAKEMSTDCFFNILGLREREREGGRMRRGGSGGSSNWGQGSIFFCFLFKIGFIACFYLEGWELRRRQS